MNEINSYLFWLVNRSRDLICKWSLWPVQSCICCWTVHCLEWHTGEQTAGTADQYYSCCKVLWWLRRYAHFCSWCYDLTSRYHSSARWRLYIHCKTLATMSASALLRSANSPDLVPIENISDMFGMRLEPSQNTTKLVYQSLHLWQRVNRRGISET